MERRKIWFIACLTLLGLSVPLFLTYSDASATKYAFQNINLIPTYYVAGDVTSPTYRTSAFGINTTEDLSNVTRPSGTFEDRTYSSQNGCISSGEGSIFAMGHGISSDVAGLYLYKNVGFTSMPSSFLCKNNITFDYKQININKYNAKSGDPIKISSLYNLLHTDSNVSFELFQIPLDIIQDEYFGEFPANTPIYFKGSFFFDEPLESVNLHPEIKINYKYLATEYKNTTNLTNAQYLNTFHETNVYGGSFTYNGTYSIVVDGVTYTYYRYDWRSPDYAFPTVASWVSPTITISNNSGESNPLPLFAGKPKTIHWGGIYMVTNNDESNFSNFDPGYDQWGSNVFDAPGASELGITPNSPGSSCSPDDWVCSFINLFDFNLINPFTPLFSMFLDNNYCVNIPTIAGMLHSQETSVCPFFDSQTRNIVTPVLGLSSIMLLFGFTVRWLGARSGNFFEDSTDGFDSGGIHVGRRKKK